MAQKKSVIGVAAFFLIAVLIVCYSAAAAEIGGKSDPYVTLSYLEGLNPDFEKTIGEIISQKTDEQMKSMETRIDKNSRDILDLQSMSGGGLPDLASNPEFVAAVAAALGEGGGSPSVPGGSASSYQKAEIEAGKTVELEMGASFFLRVGSAACWSSGETGLIDLSTGSPLADGGVIEPNHVYVSTFASERGFKTSAKVTVFIMGEYTVK